MIVVFETFLENGITTTRATMNYRIKGILNILPIGFLMRQQVRDHLLGLKYHIEKGQLVREVNLKSARKLYKTHVS